AVQLNAAPQQLRNWEWRHLESRLDDSVAALHGLDAFEWFAAFCPPEGRVVALKDGAARVFDPVTGKRGATLATGKPYGVFVAPTRKGSQIFIDYETGPLRV